MCVCIRTRVEKKKKINYLFEILMEEGVEGP